MPRTSGTTTQRMYGWQHQQLRGLEPILSTNIPAPFPECSTGTKLAVRTVPQTNVAKRAADHPHRQAALQAMLGDPAAASLPDNRKDTHIMTDTVTTRISDASIALIRDRVPIDEVVREYLDLEPVEGGSLKGRCPFHEEKTPSFHVTPNRGVFYCFGCQEGGDVITFVQKVNTASFQEAAEHLAGRFQVELRHEPPLRRTLVETVDQARAERVVEYTSENFSIRVAAVIGRADRAHTCRMLRKLATWIDHTPEPMPDDPWRTPDEEAPF